LVDRADPQDSGNDDRSSDDRRPPRQDVGPRIGGLSHGAAGAMPMPLASEKSVSEDAVSEEQHDAASSSGTAAEGQDPARAGVGGRG
jgi:hypothetical protein